MTVSHEEHGNRGMFFIESDGARVAEMTYRKTGDSRIVIDHTEVQVNLRGRGVARLPAGCRRGLGATGQHENQRYLSLCHFPIRQGPLAGRRERITFVTS